MDDATSLRNKPISRNMLHINTFSSGHVLPALWTFLILINFVKNDENGKSWWLQAIDKGENPWIRPINTVDTAASEWPTAMPWTEEPLPSLSSSSSSSYEDPLIKSSPLSGGCGRRMLRMDFAWKIAGDDDDTYTMEGDVPWMLALKYVETESSEKSSAEKMLGGATLIHPYIAITTASLVRRKKKENLQLFAGKWNISSNMERVPPQVRTVSQIIVHPKFLFWPRRYDIALLVVDEMFELGENVNTICLPPDPNEEPFETFECFVAGWGANGFKVDPAKLHSLKMARVPIVPKKECEDKIKGTKFGRSFKLHKSSICAGGNGDGPCTGDSGGPLFCESAEKQTFFLAGLISWGVANCNNLVPSIYTSAAFFKDWIEEKKEEILNV